MVKSIHHFAVVTTDVERAAKFYTELLGFRETGRLGAGGGTIVFVSLDGAKIELFGGGKPRDPQQPSLGSGAVGYTHLALSVDSVRDEAARLKTAGVEFTMEPREVEPNFWIAFFKDPDGNPLELFQRPE